MIKKTSLNTVKINGLGIISLIVAFSSKIYIYCGKWSN